MKIRKSSMLALVLVFSFSTTFTLAENQLLVLHEISSIEIVDNNLTLLSSSSELSPLSLSTKVSRPSIQRGQHVIPTIDYFNYKSDVTTANPYDDIYFVTESINRLMVLRFSSANTSCKAKLYIVDPNTMNAYDTGYEYGVGDHLISGIIPDYYWMFRVCSTANITDTTAYSLAMNNKIVPPKSGTNFTSLYIYTYDWKYIYVQYSDDSVYINDQYIYTIGSNAPHTHLIWEREFHRTFTNNGSEYRIHIIYDPKVAGITGPVKYSSKHASSNYAILIELTVNTGFGYLYQLKEGGKTIIDDPNDPYFGIRTPRPLTLNDFLLAPIPPGFTTPHIIVYCMDTGQPIDFVSRMNFYYHNEHELWPTIKQIIEYVPGDVNNDGKVTAMDSTILARWLGKWENVVINEEAADVDADGNVTPLDLTILRRHLADWAGYEILPYLSRQHKSTSTAPQIPFMYGVQSNVPAINVSSAVEDVGNIVDVNISLSDNPGIITMRLGVEFDDSILSLVQVIDKGKLGSLNHGIAYGSPYTLFWENGTSKTNYDYNGDIVTLRFEILSETLSSPVTVSYDGVNWDVFDIILEPVYFEVNNGYVSTQP